MNDAIRSMLQRYQTTNRASAERALREILQEITLVDLWRGKFFEHAAFYPEDTRKLGLLRPR